MPRPSKIKPVQSTTVVAASVPAPVTEEIEIVINEEDVPVFNSDVELEGVANPPEHMVVIERPTWTLTVTHEGVVLFTRNNEVLTVARIEQPMSELTETAIKSLAAQHYTKFYRELQ